MHGIWGKPAIQAIKGSVVREMSVALGLGLVAGAAWKMNHLAVRRDIFARSKAWEEQKAELRKAAAN
jgi:hypothetical protein